MRQAEILDELQELLWRLLEVRPETLELPPDVGADAIFRLADRVLVVEAKSNSLAGTVSEAVRTVTSAARRIGKDAVPLIAVPFMGDVGRRICEDANVGYVDLSGNALLKAPPLILAIQGRPNRFIRRGRPSSVFAPKSSRVARVLLSNPKRWWIQRELAEASGLDAGFVSKICRRLDDERLVDRNPKRALRPRDPHTLLEAWSEAYDFQKHDILQGHVSARSGEELAQHVASSCEELGFDYALTGLPAAWRLAPFAGYRLVAVYVAKASSTSLLSQLNGREVQKGSNLWLVRPTDESVFHGAVEIGGARCVSAVQTYLDLHAMPERSAEAASHLKESRLQWH